MSDYFLELPSASGLPIAIRAEAVVRIQPHINDLVKLYLFGDNEGFTVSGRYEDIKRKIEEAI